MTHKVEGKNRFLQVVLLHSQVRNRVCVSGVSLYMHTGVGGPSVYVLLLLVNK